MTTSVHTEIQISENIYHLSLIERSKACKRLKISLQVLLPHQNLSLIHHYTITNPSLLFLLFFLWGFLNWEWHLKLQFPNGCKLRFIRDLYVIHMVHRLDWEKNGLKVLPFTWLPLATLLNNYWLFQYLEWHMLEWYMILWYRVSMTCGLKNRFSVWD